MTTKGIAITSAVVLIVGIFIGMGLSAFLRGGPAAQNPPSENAVEQGNSQNTGQTAPTKTGTTPVAQLDFKKYLSPDGIELRLAKLPIKNSDLTQLKNAAFRRVGVISLIETPVTDAGLQYLQGLPLYSVALSKTKITDAGLAYLKNFQLKQLFLAETGITDAGLERIKTLPLILINLQNTKVTDKGVAELKKAIPGIQVMQ